jgi:hypothetical protein
MLATGVPVDARPSGGLPPPELPPTAQPVRVLAQLGRDDLVERRRIAGRQHLVGRLVKGTDEVDLISVDRRKSGDLALTDRQTRREERHPCDQGKRTCQEQCRARHG